MMGSSLIYKYSRTHAHTHTPAHPHTHDDKLQLILHMCTPEVHSLVPMCDALLLVVERRRCIIAKNSCNILIFEYQFMFTNEGDMRRSLMIMTALDPVMVPAQFAW
jgi:hypothetical protein